MGTSQSLAGRVTIRPVRVGDAERVADLSGQLGYPSSVEDIRRRFHEIADNPRHGFFVAELSGGEVLAWIHTYVCNLIVDDKRAEIWGLVVEGGYRNQGLGKLMMDHAERWAGDMGCRAVCLRSNVIRDGAHAFYERAGYRRVKTQHVFRKLLESSL
jgi:GNAT superfamily N-acetyltransferase